MSIFNRFLSDHSKRIVGLDILRSIAILIVVYGHGVNLFPAQYYTAYLDANFLNIDGVSIFLVLSGFLIGGILLRTISNSDFTKKDLLVFWIRRWVRTMPNYFLILFLVLLGRVLVFKDLGSFNWKYIFFLQNFSSKHPLFFPEAWSLAIEEWFYLLFPLACYGFHKLLKNKTQSILISALLFIFFPLIIRILKYEAGIGVDDFDLEFRKIVLIRLDSLMYGVIAAYILFKQPDFWQKSRLFFLSAGLVLMILLKINPFNWTNFYPPIYFNIESITTFCFLPFLSSYKSTKVKLLDSFFIFISIISYSMYLLNFTPIQKYLLPSINILLGRKNLPIEQIYVSNYIMYWFFTIVGSYLLYRIYESPMTKLRDKIEIK